MNIQTQRRRNILNEAETLNEQLNMKTQLRHTHTQTKLHKKNTHTHTKNTTRINL